MLILTLIWIVESFSLSKPEFGLVSGPAPSRKERVATVDAGGDADSIGINEVMQGGQSYMLPLALAQVSPMNKRYARFMQVCEL